MEKNAFLFRRPQKQNYAIERDTRSQYRFPGLVFGLKGVVKIVCGNCLPFFPQRENPSLWENAKRTRDFFKRAFSRIRRKDEAEDDEIKGELLLSDSIGAVQRNDNNLIYGHKEPHWCFASFSKKCRPCRPTDGGNERKTASVGRAGEWNGQTFVLVHSCSCRRKERNASTKKQKRRFCFWQALKTQTNVTRYGKRDVGAKTLIFFRFVSRTFLFRESKMIKTSSSSSSPHANLTRMTQAK